MTPRRKGKRPNRKRPETDTRKRTGRIRKPRKDYHSWVQCTHCNEYSLSDKIKRHYKRPDHAQAPFGYVAMPKGFHPKHHNGNLSQREDEPQETNNSANQ